MKPINIQQKRKYNALLMALSNGIFFGAAYLVLHLYTRFFIAYVVAFLLLILTAIFDPISLIIPLFSSSPFVLFFAFLFIFVIIDTFVYTQKINQGKHPLKEKNKLLSILGVLTIIIFIVTYSWVTRAYFTVGLHEVNGSRLNEIRKEINEKQENISSKHTLLNDPHCESLLNDPSLGGDIISGNIVFANYCYLKKAAETNNPLYCNRIFYDARTFSNECIGYLALKNNKPELCSEMAISENTCLRYFNKPGDMLSAVRYPCLLSNMPDEIKSRCEEEFLEFDKTKNRYLLGL